METIASGSLKFMLDKLIEVATEKIVLVRSFKKELADLEDHLKLIKEVLEDAERRKINDNSVKSWFKKLEVAAYDAENVLDEIKYEDSRRQVQTQHNIKPKGCLNVPCCTNANLAFRWKMARRIEDINANFKRINKRADSLGLNRSVHIYPLATPEFIDTTSFTVDPIFIGREDEELEILEMITRSTISDVLSVLPIVGMGGLGKTALARKIFNHTRTQTHFDKRIWVCVSEKFDQKTLFERILKLLLDKDSNGGSLDLEDLVQKIAEVLKDKKYLIVLDDLWNEKGKWNAFKNTLVGASSNKGNFIVVTTRIEGVASIVKTCNDPYRLKSLTDHECWSIIKKMTFEDKVPKPFEITGIEIAGKCRGLPLAANVVGRVLQGKEREEWVSILRNGLSNLKEGDEGVLEILKISYDRLLSSSMKKCFVYCSLFVKDSVLNRMDLIQLWMAEGFLPNNQGSDPESIGNNFFNILLQNFFFQEPEEDMYGNIISCKMHDLVHNLACEVSKSDGFLNNMEGRTADDIPQVRHLATISVEETRDDIKEKASYLRTLFLRLSLSDEILPYFKHLHVLKLNDAGVTELPTSIGKLKHLRYLGVSFNEEPTTLPESVCKLYNLQTLSILTYYQIQRLPIDLQFLIHLRHLNFKNVVNNFEMPPKIGSLSCLRTLPLFCVSNKEGCRIDELGELKNLKGTLEVRNLELVSSKAEAEKADMAGKLNIYKLHFHWRRRSVDSTESNINDESVLEGLQPHENLKSLTIEGFLGKNFPLWMGMHEGMGGLRFHNLIEIKFYNCKECEEILMLGHLPLLKSLSLGGLDEVTSIRSSFYGESDCSSTSTNNGQEISVSFPSLKRLTIHNMSNLTEWEDAQMQVFPCLEYLCIHWCRKLTRIPHLRGSGASLKEMIIRQCDELRELLYDLGSLQSLKILEICRCRSLESISYQNGQKGLSSLQILRIIGCDELSNLPSEMLECCMFLQSLSVIHCNKLTSFPKWSGMGRHNSLRFLSIGTFSNLNSFQDSLDGIEHMIFLETLFLFGQADWVSLPSQLQYLTSLKLLKINNFGMEALPDWFGNLSSLEELYLRNCKKLTHLPSKEAMQRLTELKRLTICGCPLLSEDFQDDIKHMIFLETLALYGQADWVFLPSQLQYLISLKRLNIHDFGMEALPDWFGNLSSLEELTLSNCEKLTHLPSNKAMQRLTKLKHLEIHGCPLLSERCRQESGPDSEWSKISYIPRVTLPYP